jgi:MarR family transcriptional regulator for hemolysin
MGFLIWQKAAGWERHLNSKLKNAGLNQSEYFHLLALFWLMQNQVEITQVELSRYLGTTTMSTSKIIQKIEKEGFVNRKTGRDSRSKAIYCTAKGEEFVVSTVNNIIKAENEFFRLENKKEVLKYFRD